MGPLRRVISILLISVSGVLAQSSTNSPGYYTNFSTMPGNNSFSFGRNYAILNLDLLNFTVEPVANTTAGATWLKCLEIWNGAVQALSPSPLTIWTRVYWENSRYADVKLGSPFAAFLSSDGIIAGAGSSGNPNATIQDALLESSPLTSIYPAFVPKNDSDIVLGKTRYYAGFGNNLENILAAQSIDTVILVSLLPPCPHFLFRPVVHKEQKRQLTVEYQQNSLASEHPA